MNSEEDLFPDAENCGYSDYKNIKIKKIKGLYINNFRTIKDKNIELGDVMTVFSGKNGTMKSTILGLIAHPFDSPNNAKDVFGNPLKTKHSDVFYLSPEKDTERYLYYIRIETLDGKTFDEPIRVYRSKKDNGDFRHRLTVGKDNTSGKGNFSLNTSYVNLKRLIPIVGTEAKIINENINDEISKFISDGYTKIFQRNSFKKPVEVEEKGYKQTFGPNKEALYDYKSISSGEDNIGNILAKMYAFVEYISDDETELHGILCIDEIEASLHPVAQINLLQFIYDWAKKYNVQVVLNTHSLYLIQYIFKLQDEFGEKRKNDIVLNMISTAFVSDNTFTIIKNPTYSEAYKELTLKDMDDFSDIYKVKVICEDEVAKTYLKKLISRKGIIKSIEILDSLIENREGNSSTSLASLIKNGGKLLENCIVLFDPDVDVKDLKKYKTTYLKLPSVYGWAIEKEIVKFICDLDGADDFFKKLNKEKASFMNDFTNCRILEFQDFEKTSTNLFKNWSEKHKIDFKKAMGYYITVNKEVMDNFISEFKKGINDKFIEKGLPQI